MSSSILNLMIKKERKQPIVSVTAYDYFTSIVANEIEPDFVLVGDSLGTVIKGESNTLNVSIDEIIYHSKIVSKHVKNALIIADMPFLTFNISKSDTLKNAGRIVVEANVDAVKIEGATTNILSTIKFLIDNNIPVMGHIGLTPQSINKIGKYKVFGKTDSEAEILLSQAKQLEDAGVFAIILECVSNKVSRKIAKSVGVPVIGIGAGYGVDGQILVISDLLGMHAGNTPKFVKKYADLLSVAKQAVLNYKKDVLENKFPDDKTSYI